MAITSAWRLRCIDHDLQPFHRNTYHRNIHYRNIHRELLKTQTDDNGHGPEAGKADNNSDLRGRLNDRHRFATFIMARTHA